MRSRHPEVGRADLAALRTIYTSANGAAPALDPAARDLLIQHYDYFANVALALWHGHRICHRAAEKTLKTSAERVFIRLGLVTAGILPIGGLGHRLLFITAIVFQLQGKIRRAYLADPFVNTAFLEGFAIYSRALPGGRQRDPGVWLHEPGPRYLPILLLIPLVMHWTARRGAQRRRTAPGFRLAPRGAGCCAKMGARAFWVSIAGLPVMILGIVITLWLVQASRTLSRAPNPVEEMLKGQCLESARHVYTGVRICASDGGNDVSRGAVPSSSSPLGRWVVSASVVAVIFGSVHPYGLVVLPTLGSDCAGAGGLARMAGLDHRFNDSAFLAQFPRHDDCGAAA